MKYLNNINIPSGIIYNNFTNFTKNDKRDNQI